MRIGFITGKDDEEVHKPGSKIYKNMPEYLKTIDKYGSGKKTVLIDSGIAWYFKNKYPDTEVDIIKPTKKNLTLERLSKNDINFLLGFDIITALHKDKEWFRTIKQIFKNPKSKLFPNWDVQNFIYDKQTYLTWFKKKGVPVLDTIYVSKNPNIEQLIKKIKQKHWTNFIIKPILGGWGNGFEKFNINSKMYSNDLDDYFKEYSKTYPKFMIQQEIEGFGTHWEIKMFWFSMGQKSWLEYAIGVKAAQASSTGEEQVTSKVPQKFINQLMPLARKIMKLYPKINGIKPAMIRMDFGCCLDGKYFLNEIENQACGYFTRDVPEDLVPIYSDLYYKKALEVLNNSKIATRSKRRSRHN